MVLRLSEGLGVTGLAPERFPNLLFWLSTLCVLMRQE
ncbi:hypothetical protein RA210_U70167 [Rubrivivax sp. A210]|nr:hypothetical protein RA210_U70167 [Rubrivivax sp. A210]